MKRMSRNIYHVQRTVLGFEFSRSSFETAASFFLERRVQEKLLKILIQLVFCILYMSIAYIMHGHCIF